MIAAVIAKNAKNVESLTVNVNAISTRQTLKKNETSNGRNKKKPCESGAFEIHKIMASPVEAQRAKTGAAIEN